MIAEAINEILIFVTQFRKNCIDICTLKINLEILSYKQFSLIELLYIFGAEDLTGLIFCILLLDRFIDVDFPMLIFRSISVFDVVAVPSLKTSDFL
jgi:hypothetical protein